MWMAHGLLAADVPVVLCCSVPCEGIWHCMKQQLTVRFAAGGSIISIERDLLWVVAAKRFLFQSSQGSKNQDLRNQGLQTIGDRVKVCASNTVYICAQPT